ncbi:hypothetical protein D3C84_1270670 [compost metagenome]
MTIDGFSCLRHGDTLLAADEQFLTEMVLKCRQLLAERRLGDVKDVGGPGNATGIDDNDK